jgi:CheY-like chemotaxis protein
MRILIADDDQNFVELLMLMLSNIGHEVVGTVTSGAADVMGAYEACAPDLVLMDFMMPHYNGVTAARHILIRQPGARVMIMSGFPDTKKLQMVAASAGTLGVLKKPFSETELEDCLAVLPTVSHPRRKNF